MSNASMSERIKLLTGSGCREVVSLKTKVKGKFSISVKLETLPD